VLPASIEIHNAPVLSSPLRIQEYGVGIFRGAFTKSALKKALKKGYVTVGDTVASTATYIYGGELIKLHIPTTKQPSKKLDLQLKVLFEDEHLAIIDKPAGILVSGNSFMTVANALPQNLQQSDQEDATRPWPVHRLDYPTTGVLLVGKTSSSIRLLSKLFEDKAIEKTYDAITIRSCPNDRGLITTDIDGRHAESHYEVLQTVRSKRFQSLNLVQLKPSTGRRHQLRRHNGKGLYLHARSLRFSHPVTREEIFVSSPLPKKYEKIFPMVSTTKI